MTSLGILLSGLAMGESPRWHENRLWFSDWGAQEIVAVDLEGNSEVVVRTPFGLPFWGIPEVARARTGRVLTIKAPARGVGWP